VFARRHRSAPSVFPLGQNFLNGLSLTDNPGAPGIQRKAWALSPGQLKYSVHPAVRLTFVLLRLQVANNLQAESGIRINLGRYWITDFEDNALFQMDSSTPFQINDC
jgi:hypothetical protein